MGKAAKTILLALIVIGSFLAGSWYTRQSTGARSTQQVGKRILYYACPMHPQYRSEKPGDCPSCGMRLEAIRANDPASTPNSSKSVASLQPGAVRFTSEQQQIVGVQVRRVERASGTYTIRTVGRVAVDDTKIYRLNAAVDGWIREIFPNSVGSLVKKDQPLVSFYSPEFLGAEQAYLYALGAMDRYTESGTEPPAQLALTRANIQQATDTLRNLGMGEIQVEEIRKTRRLSQSIVLRAPANSFVLARNVSLGQRFETSTELYRLADLSTVWILADLFENEARFIRAGQPVQVRYQGRAFQARMSDDLPQFDSDTRTLKARLEMENLDHALRPGMFVEVGFPVLLPPSITVSADAVLDSGLKKSVFVAKSDGYFEPRVVETGWRFGDRVEITKGLMPGDQVVVSGNFLLDSESRMRMTAGQGDAATRGQGDLVTDPVCGMEVSPAKAAGKSGHKGRTYYFCSEQCKRQFDRTLRPP